MSRQKFPHSLVVFLLVIAVLNWLAEYYSWYWRISWFDMLMHFAGGAWLAGVAIWWRFFSGKFSGEIPQNFARAALFGIGAAFVIGLGWEIYESFVSFLVEGHINDILDTISDLVFDMLGGVLMTILMQTRVKKSYA